MWGSEPTQQENIFGIIVSSLWVTDQWVWDLILSWLCPSYCLTVASSLSLDVEYHFLVGSGILLAMVVQQLVILVFSQEEMSAHPSTLPS